MNIVHAMFQVKAETPYPLYVLYMLQCYAGFHKMSAWGHFWRHLLVALDLPPPKIGTRVVGRCQRIHLEATWDPSQTHVEMAMGVAGTAVVAAAETNDTTSR
jgi:hypothetical protein